MAVESTFNWYWVADAMMEAGYRMYLANPAAIQKCSGMKHSDDNSDAVCLAEMLRLGILPEGYISTGRAPGKGPATQTDASGQAENLTH